ncbi:MAG: hypothetical protein HW389_3096, partial [Bacteroidetes bacterium]|nr:hypothetical protein [Bacteroidota bacterium]
MKRFKFLLEARTKTHALPRRHQVTKNKEGKNEILTPLRAFVTLWRHFSTGSLLCIVVLAAAAPADKPEWVRNNGTSSQFPDQLYLTGFGSCKVNKEFDKAKSQQRAIEVARGYLVQRIRVRIQSAIGSNVVEENSKITSYFSSVTQSVSTMEIQGVDAHTFYDEDDEMAYAIATARRDRLAKVYGEKEIVIRKEIRQHLVSGRKLEESGSKTKALDEYLACYPLFRELEEAQAILLVARTAARDTFEELEGRVAKEEVALSEIRDAVHRLLQKPVASIEDLGWNLAYFLKEQSDLKNASVLVTPFTFQDTKMGSPFARFFKQILEGKLVEVVKWSPVQQADSVQPRGLNISRDIAKASGAEHVLRGSYWKQQGKVKVIALLQKSADGKIVGSAEMTVDEQLLASSGLSLEPQNFQAALSDQKQFGKDELVGGGLMLEVWTNKGTDDLIYAQGERMQAYVRVNMPCYIRFIYHLSDGKRALLLNGYFIDESKVNVVYPIPGEFVCDKPFGAEVLQAFARTEQFDPIHTREVDGYNILVEDLEGFLVNQRGMKKVKQGTLQA